MDTEERGRRAEALARELLLAHGLEALDANWRRRLGELDLIMREPSDGTIVFVEVRYRTHAALGGGLGSIDAGKRARLRRAALAWLQRHGDPDAPARIDVVAIGPGTPDPSSVAGTPDGPCDAGETDAIDGTSARGTDGRAADGTAVSTRSGRPDVTGSDRPDRIVARCGDLSIEWLVSAVEEET